MNDATQQLEGLNLWWWALFGILVTALAFEGSRKIGAWLLLFTVFSMLAYAQEKGKI